MKPKKIIGLLGGTILLLGIPTAFAFSDVATGSPHYQAITDLSSRGIIQGYPDGTFKPDQVVNRAEALKIILLGAGVNVPEASSNSGFKDVDAKAWYAKYISEAHNLGIIQGYPDGTFKPDNPVNLVENLKILMLAKKIDLNKVNSSSAPYSDTPSNQWYSPYISYASDKKLLDPDSSNNIHPEQGMTRGSLAEVLYRFLYISDHNLDYYGQTGSSTSQPAASPTGNQTSSYTQFSSTLSFLTH